MSAHPPSHSYQSFFESEVKPKCPNDCQIDQVHVRKTKAAHDQVGPSLTIADVTGVFWNFVKFTTAETSASGFKEAVKVRMGLAF